MRIIIDAGDMAVASTRTLALLPEPEHSEQVRHRASYDRFWRGLLNEGKEAGEIKPSLLDGLTAMFIIGAMAFATEWFDPSRSTIDEVAEHYTRLFFDGVSGTKRAAKVPEEL